MGDAQSVGSEDEARRHTGTARVLGELTGAEMCVLASFDNAIRSETNVIRFLTLVFCGASAAWASSTYGIISTGDVASGNGLSDFPTQTWNFSLGGNPDPVTIYTSPVLSASGSYVFGTSTVSGSAMSWATMDNSNDGVNMHGYADATISGV